MACYHLTTKVITRSAGRSAVAAAAYRSRDRLFDERQGMEFDYTQKKDLAYSEILLPDNAPVRWKDRQTLWNEVERTEKRNDAQLAREVELALPKEFNLQQQIDLVREYVQAQFISQGMIADICIHKSETNPHVHIMLTMREVSQSGFGKKERTWNGRDNIHRWREEWAVVQNRRLLESGYDIQVDHRSFEARGIDLEPQVKIGIAVKFLPDGYLHLKDTKGLERLEEYQRICRENGERIICDPANALKHVGHYDAIFKREDIMDFAFRHSEDADQFNRVLCALENTPELIRLGKNDKGEDIFTTRTMMMNEKSMLDSSQSMAKTHEYKVRKEIIDQIAANYTMTGEQENAFRTLIESGDIAVMIGRAGTGKSYTLGAIREAYEAQGYRVRGLALSGIATEGLQNESGISSTTIFRQLSEWNNDRDRLSKDDILVLDEAGMVGTRQMHQIIEHAHKASAKVILVGDNEQLQSIEAGGSFRGILQRTGYIELADVRRQKVEWQKQATIEFSGKQEQAEKALDMYQVHGNIKELPTKQKAKDQLMEEWAKYQAEFKHGTSLMMAYTNRDVTELNHGARQYRKTLGQLQGPEYTFMTERGEREFCSGDRIIFLRNEHSLCVRNGSLGTVESISKGVVAVKLDKGDRVAFDAVMYRDFDHGYAATVHKTQGSTIDRTFVLGSRHFDKHTAYVAMSRHREDVTMYYGKDDFKDLDDLKQVMTRQRPKGLVVDYGLERGIELENKLIQAERVMNMEEMKRQTHKQSNLIAEEQYIKQMKTKGIQVNFPRDKVVNGYYTKVEEIGGNKYAVIDTSADPSKGIRYMIPYDKQYDLLSKHRSVSYDGQKMSYLNDFAAKKSIEKSKGNGIILKRCSLAVKS